MLVIQMHRGTSLFSRAIRWFTRAQYSHVSLWFFSAQHPHGGSVIEAVEGDGVRTLPADRYRAARRAGRITCYTLRHPLTPEERRTLWDVLHAELGRQYDWLGVFRFITRRRHSHDERWFCSEFAAYGLAHIGRPLFEGTEPWEVKPGDVPRSLALVPTDDPEAWSAA